jgi:peptide/nickel transport system permease protein
MRSLFENKSLLASVIVLAIMGLLAAGAGFVAPNGPNDQYRKFFYAPPTKIHFVDRAGKFHLRPFVYQQKLIDPESVVYEEDTSVSYPLSFFTKGEPYNVLGVIPCERHLISVEQPAHVFLLGCDNLGRDTFARILFGAQVSLSVGLIAVAISFPIGLLVGGLAGFYAGTAVDVILMRITELFLALPGLYLMIALRSAFPLDVPSEKIYVMMVVILSFLGWASLARVIRGMVLSLRARDFVTAAIALGASHARIIRRHILPNVASFALVQATLAIPAYILGEVTLSYLGLGVQEPSPSWGNMLVDAQNVQVLTSHWWVLSPGVAIFITVLAFNLLGDGLRDWFDPKGRAQRREG